MNEPNVLVDADCPANDFDFKEIVNELDKSYDIICQQFEDGTISDEVLCQLFEELVVRYECGAILKIKCWKENVVPILTNPQAYEMTGWKFTDLEEDYDCFEDFGFMLIQWGQFIILISGFPC